MAQNNNAQMMAQTEPQKPKSDFAKYVVCT